MTLQQLSDTQEIPTELDISHLVIEDDTPVDNFQFREQQRLLVEPLYSSKVLPLPFLAAANVGLFYKLKADPIVPDMLLSLGVQRSEDFSLKQNRSYFVWEFGKVPDVSIEIASNREGNELTLSQKAQQEGKNSKKDIYAQIGVPYYVVFDPLQQIQGKNDMRDALLRVWTISPVGYTKLTAPQGISTVGVIWLEGINLGLTLWEGQFEKEITRLWLRWCDACGGSRSDHRNGLVVPTGAERADAAESKAQQAESKAQRLAARLEALGINPDEV